MTDKGENNLQTIAILEFVAWFGGALLLNKRLCDRYLDQDKKSFFAFMLGIFAGLFAMAIAAMRIPKPATITDTQMIVGLQMPIVGAIAAQGAYHGVPYLVKRAKKALCFSAAATEVHATPDRDPETSEQLHASLLSPTDSTRNRAALG